MEKLLSTACLIFLITLSLLTPGVTWAQDRKETAPDPKPATDQIEQAIIALRNTDIANSKRWATAARKLTEIGKPAVPPLIEELDRTTADRPLRSLGFTLRAIGDPRAVPALIRAIPRTLLPPSSDFGLKMDDPDLLAFLKKNDLQKDDKRDGFSFGRPFREITAALHAITGQRFNEDELNFISLDGTPKQQWLQRWLYHGLASRWVLWWKRNWRNFTDDPTYSKISLPLLPDAPPVASISAEQPFPTGRNTRTSGSHGNVIVGPPQPQDYYRTFKDLDTGREIKWPNELPDPAQAKGEDIATFAGKEGFDLIGIEFKPTGSERAYYALKGLGLRAWQVENRLYDKIESDLRAETLPDLGRPAGELLVDFDPDSKTYHPENMATFLFVTREGTTGILQLTGLVNELLRPEDFGTPIRPEAPIPPGKVPLSLKRGFYRGVQVRYKFLVDADPKPQ